MKTVLFLLALGMSVAASAQNAGNIIEKYYEFIGGRENWAQIAQRSYKKTGIEKRMFMEKIIREYHHPRKGYSRESISEQGLFVTTTNGFEETFETTMTSEEIKSVKVAFDRDADKQFTLKPELLYYVDDLNDLEFVKKQNLDGVNLYELQTRNQRPTVTAYFDAETYVLLIVKIENQFIINFSDFRELDKLVLFPMKRKQISFETEDGVYDTEAGMDVMEVETDITYTAISTLGEKEYQFTDEGPSGEKSHSYRDGVEISRLQGVLEDHRKAVGGKNWDNINSIEYDEKSLFHNVTMKVYRKQNKGYRTEINFGGQSSVFMVNTQRAYRKQGEKRQDFSISDYDINEFLEIRNDLLTPEKKNIKLEYVEDVYIRGRRTYQLKGTFSNGVVKYYYIDHESDLLRRVVTEFNNDGKKKYKFIDFESYEKLAEGIQFPRLTYSSESGQTVISNVKINKPIADSLFQ